MGVKKQLLNLIYPPRCPVCDRVREAGMTDTCLACVSVIDTKTEKIHCMRCGKLMQNADREYCTDCENRIHFFDQGFGILPYVGWARESVIRFKFHGRQEYREFYGRLMAQEASAQIRCWAPQVIIPVPMYRKKEKKRGYNQAKLLGDELGARFGIPVREDLVTRIHDTKPQKELDPAMRRENLRTAFRVKTEVGSYQRILLVDDIYTTGSTVDAIAFCLKKAGTENVYVLTLCTGSVC